MTTGVPRSRPVLVTAAVVLWLVLFACDLVTRLVDLPGTVSSGGPWALVPVAIGLAILGWFVFGALRVGRGSGRARFWMAVLGVVGAIGALLPPYGLTTANGVLGAVAAFLPYLPAARGYFPPRQRPAARVAQPRVVGWDPDTGEPIRAAD
ncbi:MULTISPECIES: hypothetical protein [unclassified Curtobacterium]|uniref:hypothetical protein n=1 Tax=unclassified Curtobacterium TaxID=257496 RepID=UPI0008DCF939|nr:MULTISPECIES: hypothetical protein [unclassified Curtobacterium]MCT9620135.1 hypothetical protein [Curtobacterium sp. C2H10]OII28811.1 hypothetical protein BIV03_00710 [Curtobacterium sp. MCBA15_016]